MCTAKCHAGIFILEAYGAATFVGHICYTKFHLCHSYVFDMWSDAPLSIENDVNSNHSLLAYFYILLTILIKLRIVIKALLNLSLPIATLWSIFILHNIFGRQRYYFLKPNYKQIWEIILIKWKKPL